MFKCLMINTINVILSSIIINITFTIIINDIFNTYNNTSLLTIITPTIIIVDIFITYNNSSLLIVIIGMYQSYYHIVLFHIIFDIRVIGLGIVRRIKLRTVVAKSQIYE